MAEPPPNRDKTALKLARRIVREFYDEALGPGDRYLSEAEALKKHGVARGTLREALRFLEMQGVIQVRAGPGGGPKIGSPGWMHLASAIALLLQFQQASLRSVLEARQVLEPGTAELATRNASDAEIAALFALLDEADAQVGDYPLFQDAYSRFWTGLAASTHNPVVAFLSPALREIVNSAGFIPNEPFRAQMLAWLREVMVAIRDRDAAEARRRMIHVEDQIWRRLTENYPVQVERPVAWSDVAPL